MSLFDISVINATALSTSKEVCISLGDIFHSFAPSTNEDEFKMLFAFTYGGLHYFN